MNTSINPIPNLNFAYETAGIFVGGMDSGVDNAVALNAYYRVKL